MKLVSSGTTRTTLVVMVVMALITVGLSAFAYPSLSGDEKDRDMNNDSELTNNGKGMALLTNEGDEKPGENDQDGIDDDDEQDDTGPDGKPILPPFMLHATPIDGDGDGTADDVIIYASRANFFPLGGVMIYIDGIYVGSTSFEGWLFASDFAAGFHRVRGLHYDDEAYTDFWVEGVVQPRFGSLKGVVMGMDGRDTSTTDSALHHPIAGAKVEIFTPFPIAIDDETQEKEAGDVRPDIVHYYDSTTTDRSGGFSFEKVPVGRYMVRVTARGYEQYTGQISINPGEVTAVKVLLKPILPGSLTGIVLNGDPTNDFHAPIEGAKVEIFRPIPVVGPVVVPVITPGGDLNKLDADKLDFDLEGEEYLAESTKPHEELIRYYAYQITDENGKFLFEKVPEGTYLMRVTARGFHTHTERVTVNGGETTQVQVFLKPILPGGLKGFVFGKDLNGPTVNPIFGARVEIFTPYILPAATVTSRDGSDHFSEVIAPEKVLYYRKTQTDDNGAFAFEKVPVGTYMIRFTANGWLEHRGFVTIREDQTSEVKITLDPITWGSIEGIVIVDDPNGPVIQPIEGALVEIYSYFPYPILEEVVGYDKTKGDPDLMGLWSIEDDTGLCHSADLADLTTDASLRYFARTKTDEHGKFSFERVPAGRYIVRVTKDDFEPHRSGTHVKANEVTTLRIPLTPITTGILRGVVYENDPDSPVIVPIAGAKIEIFTPYPTPYPTEESLWSIDAAISDPELSNDRSSGMPVWYYDHTFTGDTGAFEFPEVPEGTYMMRVTAEGYHGYRQLVTVRDGEITSVRVLLKPLLTGRIEGTVYGEEWSGGPLSTMGNALVVIWNPDHVQYTKTDKSGGFFMDEVPVGEYVLYVFAQDYFPHKEEIRVAEGETTYTRIILKPVIEKGSLNGHIYGEELPSGRLIPVKGASLKLVNHGGSFESTTDEFGEFLFEHIPEGKYVLYVEADGWRHYKEIVEIRGGEVTYTRIILKQAPRFGALKGIVLERGDGPIAGPAKVTIFDQYYSESTITDRSGYFGFEKVPVGTYWLHVKAEKYEEKTIRVEILQDQTVEVKIELEPLGK